MTSVLSGDCRSLMPQHGPFDMIVADPPYGDTALAWDKRVEGWLEVAHQALKPSGSMWVFGSLRFFMCSAEDFKRSGWRYAQDVVWEKHNGSSFLADRFRKVHEHIVQFYRRGDKWGGVFNQPQVEFCATRRTVTRLKSGPPHLGKIGTNKYESEDGGPLLMRSVIPMRSMHGRAIHPTEKPASLLEILVRTSCPEGGLIGDFFAGSGAAGEACLRAGRRYIGAEIDETMAEAANRRLSGVLL